MIPAWMVEEMRRDDTSRFAAKVATMPRAEVVTLHEALCERFADAMRDGRTLSQRDADELTALQQRRAELIEPVKVDEPAVSFAREVMWETAYGRTVRMAHPVRCF